MIKKMLKVCFVIFIAYVLLVVNTSVGGLVYVKLNPSYAQTKTAFPLGTISILLVALEFFIFYKYKARKLSKK